MSRRFTLIALSIIAIYTALAIPTLDDPPLGRDSWRESDVLIVGRNFCVERTPLWLPRIDARGDRSGITGMELPLLNALGGWLACAGADQVTATRFITLLCALLAIVAMFALAAGELAYTGAVVAGVVFAFSPLMIYYGRATQPDVPALAFALVALLLLQRSVSADERPRWPLFLGAALSMGLGAMIKLPVVVYGLPMLVMLLTRYGWRRLARWPVVYLFPVIALGPPLLWYAHARTLQEVYGIKYFFLGKGLDALVRDWLSLKFYTGIFQRQLFTVYAVSLVSIAALITLVLGWRRLSPWLRALAVAVLAYFFLAGSHASHHFYYGLPAVPLVALLAGKGVDLMITERSRRVVTALTVISAFCMIGVFAFGVHRTRSWLPTSSAAAPYLEARAELDEHLAREQRVLLFSGGNPTALWWLDRKGWIARPSAAKFSGGTIRPRALVLPRRRVSPVATTQLEEAFREAGYHMLVTNQALAVWVR